MIEMPYVHKMCGCIKLCTVVPLFGAYGMVVCTLVVLALSSFVASCFCPCVLCLLLLAPPLQLSACVKLSGGSDYVLDLDLAGQIGPDQCATKVLSTKVSLESAASSGSICLCNASSFLILQVHVPVDLSNATSLLKDLTFFPVDFYSCLFLFCFVSGRLR